MDDALQTGDRVQVLATLKCHGTVTGIEDDGFVLVQLDYTNRSAPYPQHMLLRVAERERIGAARHYGLLDWQGPTPGTKRRKRARLLTRIRNTVRGATRA